MLLMVYVPPYQCCCHVLEFETHGTRIPRSDSKVFASQHVCLHVFACVCAVEAQQRVASW